MKRPYQLLPLLCPALVPAAAHAQTQPVPASEPTPTPTATSAPAATPAPKNNDMVIVVTATRTPQKLGDATSSITDITRSQIQLKKPLAINDLLQLVPSLDVVQSGTRDQLTGASLRGTNSNQTLVLVDGVRVNAPSFGGFDFGPLGADDIDHIEVLRGAQSALYGSDAIGGVINIITKKADSGPLQAGGLVEFGNHDTNRQLFNVGGDVGRGTFSLTTSRDGSNGFGANDDYQNQSTSVRYDLPVGKAGNLAFIGRFTDDNYGSPAQIPLGFDPTARSAYHDTFGSIQYSNTTGQRSDSVVLGMFDRNTRFTGSSLPFAVNTQIADKVFTLNAQSTFKNGQNALTIGTEYHNDQANYTDTNPAVFSGSNNTEAVYVQDEFQAGRWSLVPGVRYEDNSQFGSNVTERLAAGYRLDGRSRLKASIGTGFHNPTFDDLLYPGFSNPTLQPEKSVGFDFGYERTLRNNGTFEATLFEDHLRDLIQFVGIAPINVATAKTHGLELALNQPLGHGLRAIVSQSFLTTDSSTGQLLRRPRFKTAADLLYRHRKNELDLGFLAVGHRLDEDFITQFAPVEYGGYSVVNLTASHDIKPGVQAFVRLNNLLDRHYQPVAGYQAPGLGFAVGFQTKVF